MSMYWPGTGVTIERKTNPFGDEWFVLMKDGLEMAELDADDISDQRAFEAFALEVGSALGRAPRDAKGAAVPAGMAAFGHGMRTRGTHGTDALTNKDGQAGRSSHAPEDPPEACQPAAIAG